MRFVTARPGRRYVCIVSLDFVLIIVLASVRISCVAHQCDLCGLTELSCVTVVLCLLPFPRLGLLSTLDATITFGSLAIRIV